MEKSIKLVVCDLDNTLYDWVGYFVPALYALVERAANILDVKQDVLLEDLKKVHQKHHDSEHPFALIETDIVQSRFKNFDRKQLFETFDEAFYAFNSIRKSNLNVYSGVYSTLDKLIRENVCIIAHTESKLHSVVDRLTRLELTDYFSSIYCRERSSVSHPIPDYEWRSYNEFPMGKIFELSKHQRKPNVSVLKEICSRQGFELKETAYVGDSISRDILMANEADVFSIWAKYGASHREGVYEKLVRVSHWTEDDVMREIELKKRAASVRPDFIAERSFEEILEALDF